jgi:prepilin-type N-terminal cleavage/methylation domain-containing protein
MSQTAISTKPRRGKDGFTLLEVILAVAIAGMVMTAATALLVAAGNAWLLRDERAFLETHASGVAQFLTTRAHNPQTHVQVDNSDNSGNSTQTATRPRVQPVATTSVGTTESEPAIHWQALPGASPADEPRLTLPLAAGHPLLISQLPAEQSIEVFLQFDPEAGLALLWSSPLQEEFPSRADELNRTLLSPWITTVEYLFWDPRTERWERSTSTPYDAQNTPIIPRFIRLVFSRDGIETERLIALPATVNGGLPIY